MSTELLTRRQASQGLAAGLLGAAIPDGASGANDDVAYGQSTLPSGIRSRLVKSVNGLTMHILEAGFEDRDRPLVLLLHGFPELAYSWRKLLLPLASAGYRAVAPDQRGYGRTTGWDGDYDGDLGSFRLLNVTHDAIALISALGYRSAAAVVGHDFGSPVAAWCALIRPDVFRSVVLMSAPFAGPPALPFNTANEAPTAGPTAPASGTDMNAQLAALKLPRKHYQWYYTKREAGNNMRYCPQGVHPRRCDLVQLFFKPRHGSVSAGRHLLSANSRASDNLNLPIPTGRFCTSEAQTVTVASFCYYFACYSFALRFAAVLHKIMAKCWIGGLSPGGLWCWPWRTRCTPPRSRRSRPRSRFSPKLLRMSWPGADVRLGLRSDFDHSQGRQTGSSRGACA